MEPNERTEYDRQRFEVLGYPSWLGLLHSGPFRGTAGGTERHVLDLIASAKWPRALVAYPEDSAIVVTEVQGGDLARPLFHRYPLQCGAGSSARAAAIESVLQAVLDTFGVALVHIHHLSRWPLGVWRVFEQRRVPLFYTVHDFYCICPSSNLFDGSAHGPCPCDLEPRRTRRCLDAWARSTGLSVSASRPYDMRQHRREFGALLDSTASLICPSQRARDIVTRYYPDAEARCAVVWHGLDFTQPAQRNQPSDRPAGELRVAVLGSVDHPWKGAGNYIELVRLTRHEPLAWHFFGELGNGYQTELRAASEPGKATFHGYYSRADLPALLSGNMIDLVVMAPTVHETFSFTLSEALCSGVPVLANRLGSNEERLRAAGLEDMLIDDLAQGARRLAELARDPKWLSAARDRLRAFHHPTTLEMARNTMQVYGDAAGVLWARGASLGERERSQSFNAFQRAVESAEVDRQALLPVDPWCGPWWYRLAQRFENAAPAAIQRPLRSHFMRKHWDVLFEHRRRMCLGGNGPRWTEFALPEMAPDAAPILRIRLRDRKSGLARARLLWTHEADETFSTHKSIRIPLLPTSGWQDLLFDLQKWSGYSRWCAGPRLVALRLELLDCERELEFEGVFLAGRRSRGA